MNSPHIPILAIDDEADVLARIAGILNDAGYQCLCATSAAAAREAIGQTMPELIIADLNLAGQSGAVVCEQLKGEAHLGEVPVMFLSASQGPDIIRRTHAARGTYYLRKPFDAAVLVQLVEKARENVHLTHV
jgi:CheY-like chemotaxis protein